MTIYTKKGDTGTSTLSESARIPKSDIRFSLLGDLDELNSHIGLVKARLKSEGGGADDVLFLEDIQRALFTIGAHIYNMENPDYFLPDEAAAALEAQIDAYGKLYTRTCFTLPGENMLAAETDICRAIARRGERVFVKLSEAYAVHPNALAYVNRLSDYLYMFARVKGAGLV